MRDLEFQDFIIYELRFRKAVANYLQLQVADQVKFISVNPGSVVILVYILPGHWEGNDFDDAAREKMMDLLNVRYPVLSEDLGSAEILSSGHLSELAPPPPLPGKPPHQRYNHTN